MHEFIATTVSYTCPECEKRYEHKLTIINGSKGTVYAKGHWCKCGARHKLEYKCRFTRKGEPVVKVVQFSSNDEAYKGKKFQVGTTLN